MVEVGLIFCVFFHSVGPREENLAACLLQTESMHYSFVTLQQSCTSC